MRIVRARVTTSDGYIHNGLVYAPDSARSVRGSVVVTHGMSGTGLSDRWVEPLAEALCQEGIALLVGENRGSGIIRFVDCDAVAEGYVLGGSAYERVVESDRDVLAWTSVVESETFVLLGHSLGCTKTVLAAAALRGDARLVGLCLLSPVDMVTWTTTWPDFAELSAQALSLMSAGRENDLLDASLSTWPLSAGTLFERLLRGGVVDVFHTPAHSAPSGFDLLDATLPVLCVMGAADPFATGSPEQHLRSLLHGFGTKPAASGKLVEGADHNYIGSEGLLVDTVVPFLSGLF